MQMCKKIEGPLQADLPDFKMTEPRGDRPTLLKQQDLGLVASDRRICGQVDLGLEQVPVDKDNAMVVFVIKAHSGLEPHHCPTPFRIVEPKTVHDHILHAVSSLDLVFSRGIDGKVIKTGTETLEDRSPCNLRKGPR